MVYANKKKWILTGVFVFIVFALIFLSKLYIDYNEIREIGNNFTQVFLINLKAKIIAQSISFIFVFLIVYISYLVLRKNLTEIDSVFEFLKKKSVSIVFTIVISIIASGIIRGTLYERLLFFLNPVNFGKVDPIWQKDIGYYFFSRPFISSLVNGVLGVLMFVFVTVFVVYWFLYARLGIVNLKDLIKERGIVVHNIINLVIIILVKLFSYGIKAEDMLFNNSKKFVGANFLDVHVWKIYYEIMPFVLILVVVLALFFLLKKKIKPALFSIGIYPVVYVGFFVVSAILDTFVVSPQEVNLESEYIKNGIKYTKDAYNLSSVDSEIFPISYNLTGDDLAKNSQTLENTRIIDYNSTLKAVNQVQSIRNYYKFNDIDIVKYDIDNKPHGVAIAVREFNREKTENQNDNFINRRLRFTHGFGAVVSEINSVTKEGQPKLLTKDIPPVSSVKEFEIKEPRIYYGELTNDYVIVNSKYKELDYTYGDSAVEYSYKGKSGIKMSLINRLLYSMNYGDFQLLISNLVKKDSKLLINRNIVQRVRKAAPFLNVDDDPYAIIDSQGKIKWVVNLYTTSSNYPYSQNIYFMGKQVNYIRESVKAVVDAYDGTVKFYITDETDPVCQSYKKIYPDFFEKGKMPKDIASHLQYPEKMFKAQSEIFKKYHVDDSGVFYNKTDEWDYSKEKYKGEEQYVMPYYSMMPLYGDKDELVILIPYTMYGKQNLVSWMAVSCDEKNYGKIKLYTFPKGESIYGTMQMENRIDNDPEISKQMSLWGSGGSSVIRGNMIVIPIEKSLLYIEPVYITSGSESELPELKRIIVCYGDKIAMEETFDKAIYSIFSYKMNEDSEIVEVQEQKEPETEDNSGENVIVNIFDKIKKAMTDGNWQEFGTNFNILEKEVDKLR